jgi:ribosomal protein S18 acetylase RimI-like enzyme
MIRPALLADTPALISLADATAIFQPGEANALLGGVLEEFHAGQLGENHLVQVWVDPATDVPAGWVYFAPTARADGVWDLWWIGVDPARHGQGIGASLLIAVETEVRSAGGRVLVIETSAQTMFDPVRRFYAKRGYSECGLVPDFYADGDGKVIFAKRIAARVS